jgi:hypothetical protein
MKKFKLPSGKYRQDFFKQFSKKDTLENEEQLELISSKKEIREENTSILNTEKEMITPPIDPIQEPEINESESVGKVIGEPLITNSSIDEKPIIVKTPIDDKKIVSTLIEDTEKAESLSQEEIIKPSEDINQISSPIIEQPLVEETLKKESPPPSVEIEENFIFNSKNISMNNWKTTASLILPKITKNKRFEIVKKNLKRNNLGFNINEKFLDLRNITIGDSIDLTLLIEHKEEEDILWKSDSPIEFFNINDLNNKIISKYDDSGALIKQNILINGMGLGILPNLLSLRNDIDKILVIEEQDEIVDLIKPYLDKSIKVVNGDSLTYIKLLSEDTILMKGYFPNEQIDIIILDNWANSEDQKRKKILYLSLTQFIKRYLPNVPYFILNHNDTLQNYE